MPCGAPASMTSPAGLRERRFASFMAWMSAWVSWRSSGSPWRRLRTSRAAQARAMRWGSAPAMPLMGSRGGEQAHNAGPLGAVGQMMRAGPQRGQVGKGNGGGDLGGVVAGAADDAHLSAGGADFKAAARRIVGPVDEAGALEGGEELSGFAGGDAEFGGDLLEGLRSVGDEGGPGEPGGRDGAGEGEPGGREDAVEGEGGAGGGGQ